MATAGTASTLTDLNGLAKSMYAAGLKDLVPQNVKLLPKVSFVEADKQPGDAYIQTFVASDEAGFSYGVNADGAFALTGNISMTTLPATVRGSMIVLQGAMSYEAAAKAASSKRAFAESAGLQMKNMLRSAKKRVEIALFHGQKGLGQTSSSTNASATSTVVTLTAGTMAPGIWAGSKNSRIVFHKNSDNTLASSSTDAIFTITAVNVGSRTLTISGSSTGISALDTAIAASSGTLHNIYWYGSTSGSAGTFANKEMAGLVKIATNTGSLFGIDAATEDQWAGTSVSVSAGALTMSTVVAGLATASGKGLQDNVSLFVHPATWTDLMSDLAAQRRFDGSYNKGELESGGETIKFHSQNGGIEIVSSNIMKAGQAVACVPEDLRRVGAQDISFTTPGRSEDIWLQMASNAGYESRLFTDQALFCEAPYKLVYFSGFTNGT